MGTEMVSSKHLRLRRTGAEGVGNTYLKRQAHNAPNLSL